MFYTSFYASFNKILKKYNKIIFNLTLFKKYIFYFMFFDYNDDEITNVTIFIYSDICSKTINIRLINIIDILC